MIIMTDDNVPEGTNRSATEAAAEPKELGEIISTIGTLEGGLKNSKDELRKNVISILTAFGDDKLCRICGKEQKAHKIDVNEHIFQAKIKLSSDYQQPLSTYNVVEHGDKTFFLIAVDHALSIAICERKVNKHKLLKPNDVPLEVLLDMVSKNIFNGFLKDYLKKLTAENSEYQHAANNAVTLLNNLLQSS